MATNIRVTDARYNGKAKPGPKPKTTLSVAQHQAIQYMTLGDGNGRPMTDIQIAEACGVHRNTVRAWRRQSLFEQAYKQAVIATSADRLSEMITAMADAAINDGNARAAQLVLELNGMLGKQAVVTANPADITLTPDDIKRRLALIDAAAVFGAGNRNKAFKIVERQLATV